MKDLNNPPKYIYLYFENHPEVMSVQWSDCEVTDGVRYVLDKETK